MMVTDLGGGVGTVSATFSDWLGAQMDRVGIRSGRRLAIESAMQGCEFF